MGSERGAKRLEEGRSEKSSSAGDSAKARGAREICAAKGVCSGGGLKGSGGDGREGS